MSTFTRGALLAATTAVALTILACESPITPTPDCTLSLAPATRSFGSEGGTGSVAVTASDTSCEWTAAAGSTWITVTGRATGTGSGTVQYAVAANDSTAARIATVAIGAEWHTVTQDGRPAPGCTYTLAPSSASISSDGGPGTFSLTTSSGCVWTVASSVSWLTIESPSSGTGTTTVTYRAAANPDQTVRVGAIDAAGQLFTVTQDAAPAVTCEYSVAPVSFSPCMPAGTLMTRLTASHDSCTWTVSSDAPWLTLRSATSGRGSADIVADFGSNYDPPRLGQLLVRWPTVTAGQNVRVSQAGCYYAVSRTSFSVGADAGSNSFDVIQQSDPIDCGGALQDRCIWTAVSDVPWIVITSSMPRAGDERVSFTVEANTSATARTGIITVKDKRVTVYQAGR